MTRPRAWIWRNCNYIAGKMQKMSVFSIAPRPAVGVNPDSYATDTARSAPVNSGKWQCKTKTHLQLAPRLRSQRRLLSLFYNTSPLSTRKRLQLRVSEKNISRWKMEVAGSYQIVITFYRHITEGRSL